MNSVRVGVLGVVGGKDSGKVPGPRKLEPERGEPGPGEGRRLMLAEPQGQTGHSTGGTHCARPEDVGLYEVATWERAFLLAAAGGSGHATARRL